MPYRHWPEHPGQRRCVNCDQRLIAASEGERDQREAPEPLLVHYVCPDDHERWAYNSQSREWRQMY